MKALAAAAERCRLAPAFLLAVVATLAVAVFRLGTLSSDSSKFCFPTASWQSTSLDEQAKGGGDAWNKLEPAPEITLHEAFFERMKSERADAFPGHADASSRESPISSRFLPNQNFLNYPNLAAENVCILPGEVVLLLGMSRDELLANLTADEELYYLWNDIYSACGNESTDTCTGVRHAPPGLPENHSWVPGNTLHFVAYVGNSMHNWAERTWPHLASFVAPLNLTTPKPVHHFLVHRFSKWMKESQYIDDRKQLLWQVRIETWKC